MDTLNNEVLASQLDAKWASNLIQVLGYYQGYPTTSLRAKTFLCLLDKGEEARKINFAKNHLDLIRIAMRSWREPGVPFADLRALVHTKGDNDNAISFTYEGETIVVVLKDFGAGFIVHTNVGFFSHYVQKGLVPNVTEEWGKIICSMAKLIKDAGHKHF